MLLPLVMACMVDADDAVCHTRTEEREKKNESDERERTSVSHFEEGEKKSERKTVEKRHREMYCAHQRSAF